MDILRNIATITLYTLFFIWLFLKIINMILVTKLKCKEQYQKIRKCFKNKKTYKTLSKAIKIIAITILIIIGTYLIIAIILGIIFLLIIFFTLGGVAYIDTGADASFYDYLIIYINIYFSGFKYIMYLFYALYLTLFLFLANSIYMNSLYYKALKQIAKNTN